MADDLNQPYIGYRSAGRRRPELNDRRASADAPLAALRGMISGVAGAPGDIESLVRMLPGLSEQTVLPTSEDVERRLPLRSVSETPLGRAVTGASQIGGGFYTGPGSPLRALAAVPGALRHGAGEFVRAAGQPAVQVIKPKGGNWLAGSAEKAVEPMRVRERTPGVNQHTEEMAASDSALNKWLETKLARYIRNEMGTPEDPVRALAERGVTHAEMPPLATFDEGLIGKRRTAAGFPAEGMAQSELARRYENAADVAIHNLPASARQGHLIDENPWLLKVPPETMTYGAYPMEVAHEMNFSHLADELRNAINPESGLPAHLLWKYGDLDKVTVPQAVQRVADINAWRAAQKAEADLMRAQNPATHLVKEYPEQGFKWVELKAPKESGKKINVEKSTYFEYGGGGGEEAAREVAEDAAFNAGLQEGTREFNQFVQEQMAGFLGKKTINADESIKSLRDALKYEGETMGHCVGSGNGYCEDVLEGRSRIYSLRDKKGQPHVTIEVAPPEGFAGMRTEEDFLNLARQNHPESIVQDMLATARKEGAFTPSIVQIKGKGNRAPKEEYLPAVQDFIRSGNWGKIGDAQNAGLRKFTDVFGSGELRMLQEAGAELPNSGWLTGEDIQRLHNMITPEGKRLKYDSMGRIVGGDEAGGFAMGGLVQKYADGGLVGSNIYNSDAMQDPASAYRFADGGQAGDVRAYADGGLVANSHTADFDPARIDAIVGDLNALNAG